MRMSVLAFFRAYKDSLLARILNLKGKRLVNVHEN